MAAFRCSQNIGGCDYVPRAHDTGRGCGISAERNECGVRPSARGFDAARNSECGMWDGKVPRAAGSVRVYDL